MVSVRRKVFQLGGLTNAPIAKKDVGHVQRVATSTDGEMVEDEHIEPEEPPFNAGKLSEMDMKILGQIGDGVTNAQKLDVLKLIRKYSGIIAEDPSKPSFTSEVKHYIDTGVNEPIRQRMYRTSKKEDEIIAETVESMLRGGIVRESNSPWSSPVVLAAKKDGSWRFCIDYRKVNAVTKKDSYPIPRIVEVLDMLGSAKFFSSVDFASGYWQIPMNEEDIAKTAFICKRGLFEFTRMPFGLCNSPATFQRTMDVLLSGLNWINCLVYIDDILVFSDTFDNHLVHLEAVFQRMVASKFQIKLSKCSFVRPELDYLGHVISSGGVKPDPKKIAAMMKFPLPQNVTEVRSFVGICSYYRRFVEGFAEIAKPLYELTKKGVKFEMTSKAADAFEKLKAKLVSAPVLRYPDFGKPFILYCDASNIALGVVLAQLDEDGNDYVVAYDSRVLSAEEKRYSTTERECLAVLYATKVYRPYIHGNSFTVVTDHGSLQWLKNLKDPDGRLARWALKLQGLDMTIIHRPGTRHANADALSRVQINNVTECHTYEFVPRKWESKRGKRKTLSPSDTGVKEHDVFYVCAVGGEKVKTNVAKKKGKVIVGAGGAVAASVPGSQQQLQPSTSNVNVNDMEECVKRGQREDENTKEIIMFVEENVVPNDPVKAQRIRAKAANYTIDKNGLLYYIWQPRNTNTKTDVRKCVVIPKAMRKDILVQYHESFTGGHFGVKRTYDVIYDRYYWEGMYADVERYCNECLVCARRKSPHRQRQVQMGTMVAATRPFEVLEIDFVGPLPKSMSGNEHILVCTDGAGTRWVEAWAVAEASAETVAQLIVEEICCRYGCPKKIHSDRGAAFLSALCDKLYQLLQIEKSATTAYHPQANARVERFNGVLVDRLAMFASERDWDAYIPYALAAYRCSYNASTGFTPHYLLFGREMVMPTDVLMNVDIDQLNYNVYDMTDYVDEIQYRMKKAFDVVHQRQGDLQASREQRNSDMRNPKQFHVGDMVMVYMPSDDKGKLSLPWRGPYKVAKRTSNVNYEIDFPDDDGRKPYRVVHVDRLKAYAAPEQQ